MPLVCKRCKDTGLVTYYDKVQPFNPSSPGPTGDVGRLIKALGLKMPKKRGSDSETTEGKYLKRFGKRQPARCHCRKGRAPALPDCEWCHGTGLVSFDVFNTILDYRKRTKMAGTYIWALDPQNHVHTTYGFKPSTWRKSSENVNLQNIPVRDPELARAIRRTIIASEGCVLVEADAEAIEAVIVGYCAGDSEYIRIAKAGLHGFVASHRMARMGMGSPIDSTLPFAELRRQCKALKKCEPVQYEQAKRGNHAVNYMLSAYGMWDEYPETFPTQASAQDFIDFYHSLFTKIRPWQQSTMERAHKETYLDNHFQYRHWFYDVFAFDSAAFKRYKGAGMSEAEARSKAWTLGEDAKRSVAFVPQSDASAIQTEDLLTFNDDYPEIADPLRLITHDSFTWDMPKSILDAALPVIHSTMTRPRPELEGLTIGAEIKVGECLADMSVWEPTVKPPEPEGNSSMARTADSKPANLGSSPGSPAKKEVAHG